MQIKIYFKRLLFKQSSELTRHCKQKCLRELIEQEVRCECLTLKNKTDGFKAFSKYVKHVILKCSWPEVVYFGSRRLPSPAVKNMFLHAHTTALFLLS